MFHPLPLPLPAGITLPERFTNPFDYHPHPLVDVARDELCRYLLSTKEWHDEIERGKMFGVLVVERNEGEFGFLAAFSGYLAKQTIHPYFVPPILNLLDPNGFFAAEESNISQINSRISQLQSSPELLEARRALADLEATEVVELDDLRTAYATARRRRQELRAAGEPLEALNAESQHQKGVIRRRELHFRTLRTEQQSIIERIECSIGELLAERKRRSAALQNLTFSRLAPLNALGESRHLLSIFEEYNNTSPPAGSGDCAAPKLLHYAFANGLRPVAMGEFWWGESTRGEVRRHLEYYPACRGKCHPILGFMLRGLDVDPPRERTPEQRLKEELSVIYEDDYIVAFNKPSGLPSVRGKNHTLSVQSIAEELYPTIDPNNLIVHRLDMDTSGVLLIAKSAAVQLNLQQQFAAHTIRKRYIAIVEGVITEPRGAVELPLILDPLDRPRQRVDFTHGKHAYTHFVRLQPEGANTRLALYPQTGRTHQLRVHCAHHLGLGAPILGDRLYGHEANRLCLHAEQITLLHPATNRKFTVSCAPAF